MNKLSQFYIDKAKKELNEDETRKQQSLQQFRDWIQKHPFITWDQADDVEILLFLRSRKYSMRAVYETVERCAIFFKSHPKWFNFNGDQLSRSMRLLNDGSFLMIPNRAENGERILVVRHKHINMNIYSNDDVFRTYFMFVKTFSLECETQIAGFIVINDYNGVNLEYMSHFQFKNFLEILKVVKNLPGRMKKNFVLGIPNFVAIIYNQFTKALSEKFQKRVFFMKTATELLEHLDESLLLEEFGGNVTETQCKMEFEEKFNEKSENMKKAYHIFDVDLKNIRETDEVGSFRKLDID